MTDAVHNPMRARRLLATAAVAFATAIGSVQAAPSAAGVSPEQRVREELRAVMAELIESGAFGDKTPQQIVLDVDAPAQRVSNLGVLVDSAQDGRDGLHVLAVTPGGSGERMGLRGGDVLISLNGTPLTGSAQAATLRRVVDALPDGGSLSFEVRRGGRTETVSGALSSVYLPAMRLTVGGGAAVAADPPPAKPNPATALGCGRISDFDVAPRQQDLHGAKIISIDGRLPGPSDSHQFRVDAGTHTVQVAEKIEPRYLSFNDRLRNSGRAGDRYKTLTIDVPADTTVLIAARLNPDKRSQWQDGAYWDPVAWKQTAESCR